MPAPVTRQEALRLLGVAEPADPAAVKQAYRQLAREHHPDRGGDPSTFHRLQGAYERLTTDSQPPPPTMSRGRPSRRAAPHTSEHERADVGSIAWDTPLPAGETRLDRDRLAVLLARGTPDHVAAVTATSRAPGSRLNAVAAKLSPAFTAKLAIREHVDDRGQAVIAVELTAAGRRARRAVDRLPLDDAWTRLRRTSSTTLRSTLTARGNQRATAVLAAARVAGLLDRLDWPLDDWTTTVEGT